jgi:hypothetical protein
VTLPVGAWAVLAVDVRIAVSIPVAVATGFAERAVTGAVGGVPAEGMLAAPIAVSAAPAYTNAASGPAARVDANMGTAGGGEDESLDVGLPAWLKDEGHGTWERSACM